MKCTVSTDDKRSVAKFLAEMGVDLYLITQNRIVLVQLHKVDTSVYFGIKHLENIFVSFQGTLEDSVGLCTGQC